ncbi:MAG TPA: SpoIIE family protein phosphatase [Candidatus Baltobacteraceae bacterium]|jgi:sigma-B regulation protein RsbU (phosphoserine phosphatase)
MADVTEQQPISTRAISDEPEAQPLESDKPDGDATQLAPDFHGLVEVDTAAQVLVEHLFAQSVHTVSGIDYAVGYKLATGPTGGDIVDVYHFDNDAVALSIADISGKGVRAAVHAAMIKYGLRSYASHGLTAEKVLRSLDRLFLENNAFERSEAFASVFFGILDPTRRIMTYANAGHEPVVIKQPGEPARTLAPTAPLVGVFDDQHHLFKQDFVAVQPGTIILAATDGITEARRDNDFFGIERLVSFVDAHARLSVEEQMRSLLAEAERFGRGRYHDDVAVLIARIC